MTLSSSFKYFVSIQESTQPNKRTFTNLFQGLPPLRKQRQEKKGQKILFLLPISINVRKMSKKATLDQTCVIIATNIGSLDIGSRNAETKKQQHETKKYTQPNEKYT